MNYDEEGICAKKSAVEEYVEIVAGIHRHGAVEIVQHDDFFQEGHCLLSQDLLVYPSAGEVC